MLNIWCFGHLVIEVLDFWMATHEFSGLSIGRNEK